jgi:hypothetical protein
MTVSPSSTDEKYRLDLITQLPKPVNGMDVFYIFMIINKRHQWSAEIYDLTNNALYSTADIDVDVCLNDYGESLEEFMTETKKVAVGRSTHTGSYGGHYSGGRYGGNVGGHVGNNGKQSTSVTPVSRVGSVNSPAKTSTKEKNKSKKNEGEGKRYEYDTLDEYYAAVYGVDADDDLPLTHEEDDPTNPFYVREWGYT